MLRSPSEIYVSVWSTGFDMQIRFPNSCTAGKQKQMSMEKTCNLPIEQYLSVTSTSSADVLQSPANHPVHLLWRLQSGPGAPGTR